MAKHGDVWRSACGMMELRCGDYRDVLADVERVDAVITDPPYSERTHGAYREMPEIGRQAIDYRAFSAEDVAGFSAHAVALCSGWGVVLTDHVSFPWWEKAFSDAGRYVFSPLACMEPGARVRLSGDGPAQWSVWAVVSRPRDRKWQRWGSLPGGYVVAASDGWRGNTGGRNGIVGAKPLALMRAIVRDYSRAGDLVCDPCAGGGTTLLAAAMEGRRAIGAELDPATFEKAVKRLSRGYTPPLIVSERAEPEQIALVGGDE
jgi:site-specific DNA-methyltransferase (adenine-specific)